MTASRSQRIFAEREEDIFWETFLWCEHPKTGTLRQIVVRSLERLFFCFEVVLVQKPNAACFVLAVWCGGNLSCRQYQHPAQMSSLSSVKRDSFCLIPSEVYLLSPNVNTGCWQTLFPPIIQWPSTSQSWRLTGEGIWPGACQKHKEQQRRKEKTLRNKESCAGSFWGKKEFLKWLCCFIHFLQPLSKSTTAAFKRISIFWCSQSAFDTETGDSCEDILLSPKESVCWVILVSVCICVCVCIRMCGGWISPKFVSLCVYDFGPLWSFVGPFIALHSLDINKWHCSLFLCPPPPTQTQTHTHTRTHFFGSNYFIVTKQSGLRACLCLLPKPTDLSFSLSFLSLSVCRLIIAAGLSCQRRTLSVCVIL